LIKIKFDGFRYQVETKVFKLSKSVESIATVC
jgi:hypothetical protein